MAMEQPPPEEAEEAKAEVPDLYSPTPEPPAHADEDWELNQEPWQPQKEERKKAPKAKQPQPVDTDADFAFPLSSDWARAHTAPPAGQRIKANSHIGKSVLNLSNLRAAPKYSFKVSKDRFTNLKMRAAAQVPGPGAYTTTAVLSPEAMNSKHKRSPGYGFGTSSRQATPRNQPPGPGTYAGAARGFVGTGRAASLTPRRKPPEQCKDNGALISPGPGTHNVPPILGTEGPKYTVSDTRRASAKVEFPRAPGPGYYGRYDHVINMVKPKDPSYGFGTCRRPGSQTERGGRPVPGMKGMSSASAHDSKLPGPGSYEFASLMGEGPKHSLGAKRAGPRSLPSPGPGDACGQFTTFA